MSIRRGLMMGMPHGIDTTPVIDEYGVCWSRTYGSKTAKANWGVTKFYDITDAPRGNVSVMGFIGADNNQITFQYSFINGRNDWYYFAGTNPRSLPIGADNKISSITFSIETAEIDNSYAYIVQTGQILFAGKNTQYYGHRNISELS